MEPWEIAAAVAIRQHMWIATWQAEAVGIDRHDLAARVKFEGWQRFGWGVTGWPGPRTPLRELAGAVLTYGRPTHGLARIARTDEQTGEELAAAVASAALEAGQAVTGRSGAWLHGFAPQPTQHWVWLPSQSPRTVRPGVALRYGGDLPGPIVWREGLPCFDPAACTIETARTPQGTHEERVDEVVWQMSRADSQRIPVREQVEERLPQLGNFRGVDVLAEAVEKVRGAKSHSKLEHRGRELALEALAELGLQGSTQPVPIFHEGVLIAEADIAVIEIWLDLEIDGPHHNFLDQRLADQERDRQLRRSGWEVERFPEALVRSRPRAFKAQVRAAAEARLNNLRVARPAPLL